MNPVVTVSQWLIPLLPATEMGKGIAVGLAILATALAAVVIAVSTAWVLNKAGLIND